MDTRRIIRICKINKKKFKAFTNTSQQRLIFLHSQENINKIKQQNNIVIPCASEGELVLRKGAKKGLWYYLPGDSSFVLKDKDLIK